MRKNQNRLNKRILADTAHIRLEEEFRPINLDSNVEYSKRENIEEKPKEPTRTIQTEDYKEINPLFADMPGTSLRKVSNMGKLPNGFTPYELMYGQVDNEDLLQIYIEMS